MNRSPSSDTNKAVNGLRGRSVYAWALYDWANSAFATTVMAGFFPLFFKEYYSAGADATVSTAQLGSANALASLIIVVVAPLLGAIADAGGLKKRLLFLFAYLGILMTFALAFAGEGQWELAAMLYVLGSLGFMGSNLFYDALLPSVCSESKRDAVSGLGFALGYLGGGVLFAFNVWMVQSPETFGLCGTAEAVQLSFASVAIWWALFSLPLFLFVPEPHIPHERSGGIAVLSEGYRRLMGTVRKLRRMKGLMLFLAAYWLYIDGVDTVIRMAVDYGIAIGFESSSLIQALLIVQFVGFPATLLYARLAQRWETKKAILSAIAVYVLITLWAAMMRESFEFFLLATLIACVQGGIQALSRSYYSRMIPTDYAGEFFGFYNVLGKFAAVLGPLTVGAVAMLSGSSRLGIASIVVFFAAGAWLLWRVDERRSADEVRRTLQALESNRG